MMLIRGTTSGTWYATAKRHNGTAWLYYRVDSGDAEVYDADNASLYVIDLTRDAVSGDADAATPAGMLGSEWEVGYYQQAGAAKDFAADFVSAETFGVDGQPKSGANVTVTPLQVTVVSNRYTLTSGATFSLQFAHHETTTWTWTVVDADGEAVDLSGEVVRLVLHVREAETIVAVLDNDTAGGIVIDGNQLTLTVEPPFTAERGLYDAKLWRDVDDSVPTGSLLASGTIAVKLAPIKE